LFLVFQLAPFFSGKFLTWMFLFFLLMTMSASHGGVRTETSIGIRLVTNFYTHCVFVERLHCLLGAESVYVRLSSVIDLFTPNYYIPLTDMNINCEFIMLVHVNIRLVQDFSVILTLPESGKYYGTFLLFSHWRIPIFFMFSLGRSRYSSCFPSGVRVNVVFHSYSYFIVFMFVLNSQSGSATISGITSDINDWRFVTLILDRKNLFPFPKAVCVWIQHNGHQHIDLIP
ncbi:hypothetical protein L9F63_010669, partial [Diploptera punctata]